MLGVWSAHTSRKCHPSEARISHHATLGSSHHAAKRHRFRQIFASIQSKNCGSIERVSCSDGIHHHFWRKGRGGHCNWPIFPPRRCPLLPPGADNRSPENKMWFWTVIVVQQHWAFSTTVIFTVFVQWWWCVCCSYCCQISLCKKLCLRAGLSLVTVFSYIMSQFKLSHSYA